MTNIAKAAIQLRAHTEAEVREAFLSDPNTARAWESSPPIIVDLMRKLGAPIPNLKEIIRELPPATVGERASADDKPDAVHNTSRDKESCEEGPEARGEQ